MPYIYSTLTADNTYVDYKQDPHNKTHQMAGSVTIKGGANLSSKNLITPLGMLTTVTEKELETLQANLAFKRHVRRGFIRVEQKEQKIKKVAAGMTKRDKAAPRTPDDIKAKKNTEN